MIGSLKKPDDNKKLLRRNSKCKKITTDDNVNDAKRNRMVESIRWVRQMSPVKSERFGKRNTIILWNSRIKAGMDDDMNSVNLKTNENLENKIQFFYQPYNSAQMTNFYMKFEGENKKSSNIKTASEVSLEKMWKRISEFILKIDEEEFKKTIDSIKSNELNEIVKQMKKYKERKSIKMPKNVKNKSIIRDSSTFKQK